jgi:hypothetical protein
MGFACHSGFAAANEGAVAKIIKVKIVNAKSFIIVFAKLFIS